MFTLFFREGPVTDWESARESDTSLYSRFFHAMLQRGVLLPPSQFEASFLSAAHTEKDIMLTLAAARESFAALRA